MIVYDVVKVVRPGTPCSTEPGRWLEATHDREADAWADVYRANVCVTVPGITYVVECHDEESEERAPLYRDRLRAV